MAELKTDFSLAPLTRFKTGGPAQYFFEPESADDLAEFLCGNKIRPITVLGLCSNALIRDGGIPGLVIYTGALNKIWLDGELIAAGAGATLPAIAWFAHGQGAPGFEFMIGIPGTAAGGLYTNAGCFGGQISDVLESVIGFDHGGNKTELSAADCGLSYRAAKMPDEFIATELRFRASFNGDGDEIKKKMDEIVRKKKETQPTDARTAGSTFKNPTDGSATAWQKIKAAFPDGLSIGGARISEKHANFIVAEGDCKSADIEGLIEQIQSATGLELEIKIIGK